MIEVPLWVLIGLAATTVSAIALFAWAVWADRAEGEAFAAKENFFDPKVSTAIEPSKTTISTQRYNELIAADQTARQRANVIEQLREEQRQERQFVEERSMAVLVTKALVMLETDAGRGAPIVLTRGTQKRASEFELVVHREDGELEVHVRETGLPPDRKWVTA